MNREMLVSDDACGGCVHYGTFYPGIKCCRYLFDTGITRPRGEMPAACSVKEPGRRSIYIRKLIQQGLLAPDALT